MIAYLIFGFLTVVVNIVSFQLLSDSFGIFWGNTVAFFMVVSFAYWTNTKFVFQSAFTWKNLLQFWTMRIGTLLIDDGGVILLINAGMNKLLSKITVNMLIIIINFVCSKFFIYKKEDQGER